MIKFLKKTILDREVSKKILPILRKIVSTKDGTAKLANVDGYEIGGKTGTANKIIDGVYSNKKINTFISVFPTSKPKFALAVMLDGLKTIKIIFMNLEMVQILNWRGVQEIHQDGLQSKL